MGSSFKGVDLFGSGPHRFEMGVQGVVALPLSAVSGTPTDLGTLAIGDRELRVTVRGRLVAGSESALWTLRDAVTAKSVNSEAVGTLVDENGRSWASLKFLKYTELGPTDRGREWSVGYEALFGEVL